MPAADVTNSSERRKRLGQYFTGNKLAHLLAVIADCPEVKTVIDPMCGSGDMLLASNDIYPESQLYGIEIDSYATELCEDNFISRKNKPFLCKDNAFSWSTISRLPTREFDLVITNPPYVRYQSMASNSYKDDNLPDAESVRKGLLEIAQNLYSLSEEERHLFTSIIEGYSGLSDLAVPSWILCAMLTAPGGTIAMVVPESWLSRDYASPIQYLLLKLFKIRWVIEDSNSVWFNDALVKTTLLVAKRIKYTENWQEERHDNDYLHVLLPEDSINSESIVGNFYRGHLSSPDNAFKEELIRLSEKNKYEGSIPYSFTRQSVKRKRNELFSNSAKTQWLRKCEPELLNIFISSNESISKALLPQDLLDLFSSKSVNFTTIEQLGFRVGQGLRTGANDFFYCELLEELEENCLVVPGKVFGIDNVLVPKNALLPVLRKQNELPKGYQVNESDLMGRVLFLDKFIHPRDKNSMVSETDDHIIMPNDLANFVTLVERTNIGSADKPKWTPKLSAVRTNESKRTGRFWYMLPPLARRHIPDLLVPRVNYLNPKVILNSSEKVIIDANFSTIWTEEATFIDKYALLSLLNSSWAIAAMELIATVMGGGALKLEATHLRRLPIPNFSNEQWSKLSLFGKELVIPDKEVDAQIRIDKLIGEEIFGKSYGDRLQLVQNIKAEKLVVRKRKKNER